MIQKMKKGLFATAATLLAFPAMVSAAIKSDYGLPDVEYNGSGTTSVVEVIVKIVEFLLAFVGALAVLMIIVSGIWYITSGGDEGRVETAKKYLIFAVIGLVVALLGWIIVNTVKTGLTV